MREYKIIVRYRDGDTEELGPYDMLPGEGILEIAEDIRKSNDGRYILVDADESESVILMSDIIRSIRVVGYTSAIEAPSGKVIDLFRGHPAENDGA